MVIWGKIEPMKRLIQRILYASLALLLVSALFSPMPVKAETTGIKYTVQEGDTVDSIATAFHTTAYRIRQLNYFADADYIYPGRKIIIPGFDDIQGEVTKVKLPFGQSLPAYFNSLNQPFEVLQRLNFITSIDQFYAGAPVFIMYTDQPVVKKISVTEGLTGLELAVNNEESEWITTEFNDLRNQIMLVPNTSLSLPDKTDTPEVDGISTPTQQSGTTITPFPLLQGKTAEIITESPSEGATLSGSLTLSVNDTLGQSANYSPTTYPLSFFPTEDGKQVALQGVHRFARPGFAAMVVSTTYPDGSIFSYQQNLLVKSYDYGTGAPIIVDESFIDPSVTVPEWEMIKTLVKDAPALKEWTFGLSDPSPSNEDWISRYGLLRSYNDSEYIYFHSGIDYQGNNSTQIFAAAAGVVVFAQELDVRGGATIISHGRGVYTGYWHQSQIDVKVGDHVEAGQTIGLVGATGRVTGAHLHFEVIVGGVQVDPVEWLQGMY